MSLLISACGNGGGDDDTLSVQATVGSSTTDTAIPACADVQNTVVLGVFGVAAEGGQEEGTRWANDPEDEPVARAGAADVASAYRDLGYEVFYVTLLPAGTTVDGRPLVDAITLWLGVNGFPIGEDASVWAWDGEGEAPVALIEKLTHMSTAGVDLDAGYAGDPEMVFPMVTGGIPRDRMFTVGRAAGGEDYTSLPADLGEHLPEVEALDPVCER